MDWTHTLTIIGTLAAFLMYISSRLDSIKKELKLDMRELKGEIKDLDKKIEGLQKDLNRVDSNISNIEGQITQMTRPGIPIERYQHYNTRPPEDGEGHQKAQNQ